MNRHAGHNSPYDWKMKTMHEGGHTFYNGTNIHASTCFTYNWPGKKKLKGDRPHAENSYKWRAGKGKGKEKVSFKRISQLKSRICQHVRAPLQLPYETTSTLAAETPCGRYKNDHPRQVHKLWEHSQEVVCICHRLDIRVRLHIKSTKEHHQCGSITTGWMKFKCKGAICPRHFCSNPTAMATTPFSPERKWNSKRIC